MEIKRDGYTVHLGEPILHVDNESRKRSGHMSHAMAEFAPGKIIAFNSNCTPLIDGGHSTFGFIEYKISEDGGESFSDPRLFPYSIEQFLGGIHTVSVEKAVACDNGRIVAFCLLNDAHKLCPPWIDPPVCVMSDDGGETWSEAKKAFSYCGRIYDAIYYKGVIYVVQFCNDATVDFVGNKPEHVYRIYASYSMGESFEELCVVPTDSKGRAYASIIFDSHEQMHLYVYNVNAEHDPDHLVSEDFGKTFKSAGTCHLAKGSRNIQTALIDGIFVLHCRGEEINRNKFPLYTSLDGYTWDEGEFIDSTDCGTCFYSNNLLLKDKDGKERLLIQYSHSYYNELHKHYSKCTNERHMWLTVKHYK